jgi:hypothetical protein
VTWITTSTPLAARLSKTIGPRLVSVWGTKQHCQASFARTEPATPIHARSSPGHRYTVRTNTSSQSIAFKQQIHDQLTGAATLPDGPVSMQLSFTVGPGRNWLSLWKPTIDAQGRILGHTNPSQPCTTVAVFRSVIALLLDVVWSSSADGHIVSPPWAAETKASAQHDADGRCYRSFRGLLAHFATLTRNDVRFPGTHATVPVLTEPTSRQRQAFDLIGAPIPLALT